MATKFNDAATNQLGGVQPWSVGGDMPWSISIVESYEPGSLKCTGGYFQPVHPDGLEAPRFHYLPGKLGDFSRAAREVEEWVRAAKLAPGDVLTP